MEDLLILVFKAKVIAGPVRYDDRCGTAGGRQVEKLNSVSALSK
jgi:hypothetical protein